MANASRESALLVLSEKKTESSNLSSKDGIIRRLRKGPEARVRFVDSHLSKGLAFQLRSLRDQKYWSQIELANAVGMNQNAISRLENPNYGKASLTTLKRLAAAFDVGLIVSFVPFSHLVNRVSATPHMDLGLSRDTMNVRNFEQEDEEGTFDEQQAHNGLTASCQSAGQVAETLSSYVNDYAQPQYPTTGQLVIPIDRIVPRSEPSNIINISGVGQERGELYA